MNTDRGLLFLALALTSLWLVFDEFFGGQKISKMAERMTPNLPSVSNVVADGVDKVKEKVVTETKKKADEVQKETDKEVAKHPVESKWRDIFDINLGPWK